VLPRGVVHPVVLLEVADPPREVGRQLLQLLAPLLRELFEQLLAALGEAVKARAAVSGKGNVGMPAALKWEAMVAGNFG
jgi:hypothetical protein